MDIFAFRGWRKPLSLQQERENEGLRFRLSDGDEMVGRQSASGFQSGQVLSESETSDLLARTEPFTVEKGESASFKLRQGALPVPKTGERGAIEFPKIGEGAPKPMSDPTPLSVVRISPEGEVGAASELFVTFSEPMVPIGSQQDAASFVPVALKPEVKGKWRWLGSRTIVFAPENSFPFATEFSVTVPEGTRSANGKTLPKTLSRSFRTSSPKVISFSPNGEGVSRSPLMVLAFDQDIDRAKALSLVRVSVAGRRLGFRSATEDEMRADKSLELRIRAGDERRFLVFKLTEQLQTNIGVEVLIGKGVSSLEGPLSSDKEFRFSFKTHGPFELVSHGCGWQNECRPASPIQLQFSNQVDGKTVSDLVIKSDPPIVGLKVVPSYNGLTITGIKKPRTTTRLTVSGELRDIFGQTLGRSVSLNFEIGGERSELFVNRGELVTLDPFLSEPRLSFHSINIDSVNVRIRSVLPTDWKAYKDHLRNRFNSESKNFPLPGRIVFDDPVNPRKAIDEIVRTDLDFSPWTKKGVGHFVLEIEKIGEKSESQRERIVSWIQVTRLGLDAFIDREELVAYVSDLRSGRPIQGAAVMLQATGSTSKPSGISSESGVVRIQLPEKPMGSERILVASAGEDTVFIPSESPFYWDGGSGWSRQAESNAINWFVFNDRNIYRPGEEVSIKGYVRSIGMGKGGDVLPVSGLGPLTYKVTDARGNEITSGETRFNGFGAFDLKVTLPQNINLGSSLISFGREPGKAEHVLPFQVEEFRRPEFEVETKVVSEGPHMVGGNARVMASAKYFAGGGLAESAVAWRVEAKPSRYSPPNRDEYSFGTWVPWWKKWSDPSDSNTQTFSGTTDGSGNDFLKIDFDAVSPARPYSLEISSAVFDVNRQVFSASTSMLVHPSDFYVGIKTQRSFVEKGSEFAVDVIATDLDGNLVSGRKVSLVATLTDWVFKDGEWVEEITDSQRCEIVSSLEPGSCSFVAKAGGRYLVVASVVDDKGRPNESELRVWVPGGRVVPSDEWVEEQEVEMIPSKSEYAPGETAEILVTSPFGAAEGILTLRRGGIVSTERFDIEVDSAVLRIPITEKYLPNVFAHVRLLGSTSREGQTEAASTVTPRPAFASGSVGLNVSTASRRLGVEVIPQDRSLVPGAKTRVSVNVRDADGRPLKGSEVALVVVDESVLALTDYSIDDPLAAFYPSREEGVANYDSRSTIVLGEERVGSGSDFDMVTLASLESREFRAPSHKFNLMMAPNSPETIRTRVNFNPLALFLPSVETDEVGSASIEFELPDNLTRYRVTAVAVDGAKRFGKGDSSITARQALMVRPAAPRFANFGDRFELPVVIQNQTDSDMTVDVAVRTSNLKVLESPGRRITIPGNNRAEIRFPVETVTAGTSRIQFVASGGGYSDAAVISIPIYTPATTETFAAYGSLDSQRPLNQPVSIPKEVFPEYGGLELSVSSTQLQELTDAFLYLYRYPFECTEQISSRILSIGALRDVLREFKSAGLPNDEMLGKMMGSDIDSIVKRQRADGSFGFWGRSPERYEYPFVSVHATHALAIAREKGYEVPKDVMAKSLGYLREVEKRFDSVHSQSLSAKLTISAYALHVRSLLGDRDYKKAKALLAQHELAKFPPEALGWILGVLSDDGGSKEQVASVKRFLLNQASETASTASFNSVGAQDGFLVMHSSRRADGVLLDAFLKVSPDDEIIPKLVRGLLAQRKRGSWANTQENVFILLALDRYFRVVEGVTPDFVARLWYGDAYGGEVSFSGRTTRTDRLDIPMEELLARGQESELVLQRDGKGRLYYRVGLSYAPKSMTQEPADFGFEVSRTYEAVDSSDDVVRNSDGSWNVKAGARVRVKLQMSASARRYHVALVDNLPAGFEVLNPGLAITESIPQTGDGDYGNWWRRFWYEHRNLRDDRVEAFASILAGGVYEYSYTVRATTPGEFVVPAAKAEEMYAPETFGRSASDKVVIK